MKFLIAIVLLPLISCYGPNVIDPKALNDDINLYQIELGGIQFDYTNKALTFRLDSIKLGSYFANKIVDYIQNQSTTYYAIAQQGRDQLAQQPQTPCIINLDEFLLQIIEYSGYALSNCVEDVRGWATVIESILDAVRAAENDISDMTNYLIDLFYGRNYGTEPEAFRIRYEEFKQNVTSIDLNLEKVSSLLSTKTDEVESYTFEKEKECYGPIEQEVGAAVSQVLLRIPQCQKFTSRGARFNLDLDAKDFFPEVAKRNLKK